MRCVSVCRKVDLVDVESWTKVEHLYKCMRLHNTILSNWIKCLVPPVIFIWVAVVTVLLYITFRPSGLPMLVYCWFPLVAVCSLFILTWLLYDAVTTKRSADEVLSKLQSRTSGFCTTLRQPAERKEFKSRSRALQPVRLTIGELTEATVEMIVSIWEEVLNQLLFLLTL